MGGFLQKMDNKASPVQDRLYQWALDVYFESKSGFDVESSPYILATDFPFLVWSRLPWQGKKVLIIADSGDNIFTLWPLGVARIVAIDIARKACFVNELKYVALKNLSFGEFCALFAPVYENKIFPAVTPAEKKELYLKLRHLLSPMAQSWLDTQIGVTNFPSPSWRELMFVHLIPHFSSEKAFYQARQSLKPYSLINLPVEMALTKIKEKFDVIYLSNIPEYIKQSLKTEERDTEIFPTLEKLYAQSLKRLKPSGYLMFYSFGDALSSPALLDLEIEISKTWGLSLERITFSFSTPLIKNSHFKHTLVIMKQKG